MPDVNLGEMGELLKQIGDGPTKQLLLHIATKLAEDKAKQGLDAPKKFTHFARGPKGPVLPTGGYGKNYLITPEGGFAVKLTNKTGAASVKGSLVHADETTDLAFSLQTVEFDTIGAVYEDGQPDGQPCFVVMSGIAEVLLEDGNAAVRGYWVKSSDTDGRAEVTTPPSGLGQVTTSEHFKEIGHCLESKDAGTDVLAKIAIHFL